MPSWTRLVKRFDSIATSGAADWLDEQFEKHHNAVSEKFDKAHVITYASAWMQKSGVVHTMLTQEDINGFMGACKGAKSDRLVLILHTPGGYPTAAETIVGYLRSKFSAGITVIVPAAAMSAGTMIALAANKIIMGRQSQLGPIDPQMSLKGAVVSAQSLLADFEKAKADISGNPSAAHAWAPILDGLTLGVLSECERASKYGQDLVKEWLKTGMLANASASKAASTAKYFNDSKIHNNHGTRIDRDVGRSKGLKIDDLEDDQELQDDVLTIHHLLTIVFHKTIAAKAIYNNVGHRWIKNLPQG